MNAQQTFESVVGFVNEREWSARVLEDQRLIMGAARCDAGMLDVLIAVGESPTSIELIIHLPFAVPEDRRATSAELSMRINRRLGVGRFDLDMDDGDLTFHAAIPMEGAVCTAEQFHSVLQHSVLSSIRYHRPFGRLVFDPDLTPKQALAELDMAQVQIAGNLENS